MEDLILFLHNSETSSSKFRFRSLMVPVVILGIATFRSVTKSESYSIDLMNKKSSLRKAQESAIKNKVYKKKFHN